MSPFSDPELDESRGGQVKRKELTKPWQMHTIKVPLVLLQRTYSHLFRSLYTVKIGMSNILRTVGHRV